MTQKFDLEIDNRGVVACARELLAHIQSQMRASHERLAEVSGLHERRVRTILSLSESKKLTSLSLEQIQRIVELCQQQMESSPDRPTDSLVQSYFKLLDTLFLALESAGMSPTEYAFRSHFNVDPARQKTFSDSCAGIYAIVRLTNRKRMVITPITVHAKERGQALCRFKTIGLSEGSLVGEQDVEGYIYESDGGYIHAVGGIEGTGHIRSTVLRRVPGKPDLFGLRVSISDLDLGAFAYRLYCKRLIVENDPAWLNSWRSIFTLHEIDGKSLQAVEAQIPEIEKIVRILREPPEDSAKHWGVDLPEGRKS